ncbi:D-alanine-D-alanine ligase [Paenibacillus phyllosphaerae]|uniref:D-alanine-D-alanine ligase n=1 Tax=Paenibacillus phyllosphaerae TaxID=274593 RepID=A0A7W5FPV7_9BACL|nr:hypothetical protein [Paenibacillus phyllosphaerae]MBB3112602.1 D-alanine-D-alanine ligase [Paenibacillus phyllosphaerae]
MGEKVRVGLVYGGRSAVQDQALQAAITFIRAIHVDRYELKPYYMNEEGQWFTAPCLSLPAEEWELVLQAGSNPAGSNLPSLAGHNWCELAAYKQEGCKPVDVVLSLLPSAGDYGHPHQGVPELADVPYVSGAGWIGALPAEDRIGMKQLFEQAGLPQPIFRHFNRTQWMKDPGFFVMEIEVSVGYPCMLTSVGAGEQEREIIVHNRGLLLAAINYLLRLAGSVVVEEYVEAQSISVDVMGCGEPNSYFAVDMDPGRSGNPITEVAAVSAKEVGQTIRNLAVQAARAVGGLGLLRVQIDVSERDGTLVVRNVQPAVPLGPVTWHPALGEAVGFSYGKLVDTLIAAAREHPAAEQDNDGVA